MERLRTERRLASSASSTPQQEGAAPLNSVDWWDTAPQILETGAVQTRKPPNPNSPRILETGAVQKPPNPNPNPRSRVAWGARWVVERLDGGRPLYTNKPPLDVADLPQWTTAIVDEIEARGSAIRTAAAMIECLTDGSPATAPNSCRCGSTTHSRISHRDCPIGVVRRDRKDCESVLQRNDTTEEEKARLRARIRHLEEEEHAESARGGRQLRPNGLPYYTAPGHCRCGSTTHKDVRHPDCALHKEYKSKRCMCGSSTHRTTHNLACPLKRCPMNCQCRTLCETVTKMRNDKTLVVTHQYIESFCSGPEAESTWCCGELPCPGGHCGRGNGREHRFPEKALEHSSVKAALHGKWNVTTTFNPKWLRHRRHHEHGHPYRRGPDFSCTCTVCNPVQCTVVAAPEGSEFCATLMVPIGRKSNVTSSSTDGDNSSSLSSP